jgi:catechol 2,3-dioxygenase-like lactoylglutathione lyase family enzyme
MTIALDHILIPSRNRKAAAERLASLLGVPWAPAQVGPFTDVYVNDGLTLDFDEWQEDFPKGHYCFRVSDAEFDAILQRIEDAGIAFRGSPHGPNDNKVNEDMGGRILYWNEPDGHVWEILTQSYARRPE